MFNIEYAIRVSYIYITSGVGYDFRTVGLALTSQDSTDFAAIKAAAAAQWLADNPGGSIDVGYMEIRTIEVLANVAVEA